MTDGGCQGSIDPMVALKADFEALGRRCRALEAVNEVKQQEAKRVCTGATGLLHLLELWVSGRDASLRSTTGRDMARFVSLYLKSVIEGDGGAPDSPHETRQTRVEELEAKLATAERERDEVSV